jgi:hypothetical protein
VSCIGGTEALSSWRCQEAGDEISKRLVQSSLWSLRQSLASLFCRADVGIKLASMAVAKQ